MRLKTMITLLFALALCMGAKAQTPHKDSLLLVFWNVENFFDYRSYTLGDLCESSLASFLVAFALHFC